MTVGKQIALRRKQKGITQEMLSEISGISLRTIQRIECNQSVPRVYTLKILATHLDISLEDLTGTESHHNEVTSATGTIPVVQRMNSANLTILLLPFMPLLIILLIWARNKKNLTINTIGKRIISFQIIWLILTAFVLAATQILYYYFTGARIVGHLSPLLPSYLVMLAFNVVLVIRSALMLQKQELGIYRFVPSLF